MAEITEAKKDALYRLVEARDRLRSAGFDIDMVETVGLEHGGLVIRLEVKGLNIVEANYLVNLAFGLLGSAT